MRVPKLLMLAVALSLIAAAPASAHHGVTVKTIAKKLDNPRHVAVAPNGDVYVAESGRGGDPKKSKSCFDSAEGFACTGATGAITRVFKKHGKLHTERVVRGLASFAPADGASAIGPHGVFVHGSDVYFTNGGPTEPTRGTPPVTVLRDPTLVAEEPISRLYGTLLKLDKRGRISKLADIWRFERDNNPDAEVGNDHIDSNPVDVFAGHHGLLVADAGENTVLRIGRHGGIDVVSVFPNLIVPSPFGGVMPMQAVPTGVVVGPDGYYYVSQLTGFPFPIGGAKIFRVNPRTGAFTTYASGFTNAMDLAFGPDGTLYVLEIDHDSLFPPAGPSTEGALFRVPRGGGTPQRIELPVPLTEPGGLAVAGRKTLVISNHGREAGKGEVLEVTLDR